MKPDANLPNFLIIGAMRSGTTSLFAALAAHPQVFGAPGKELRFFDLNYERGIDWYGERFQGSKGKVAIGEASQTYIYDPLALDRMAAHVPDARLIAILRDPVERAYSHYWLNRSRGREPLSFEEALEAEEGRLKGSSRSDRFFYSYVDRGHYKTQLDRVCSLYDRSGLHVVLFDDLRDHPVQTFEGLCRFLGVEEGAIASAPSTQVNAFQRFRSLRLRAWTKAVEHRGLGRTSRGLGALNRIRDTYPPMSANALALLGERFGSGNLALSEWLGRDLTAWAGMGGTSRLLTPGRSRPSP
jgi:hypothetical protein